MATKLETNRNVERNLFHRLVDLSLELKELKESKRRSKKHREEVAELKHKVRVLRAQHIKAAARLDRARAKLGVEARGING